MDDTEKKTVQALVLRNFEDAGTGETFTKSDDAVPIEEGAFANYHAGGLVEAAPVDVQPDAAPTPATDPAPDASADGTPGKSGRTRG
jgi:hypothetical protein